MSGLKKAVPAFLEYAIYHCRLSIFLINAFVIAANTVIFYFLIPVLLNFPPQFMEYSKRYAVEYWLQFLVFLILDIILVGIVIMFATRETCRWKHIMESDAGDRDEKISIIRKKCLSMPYLLYFHQIVLPVVILAFYFTIFGEKLNYSISVSISIILIIVTFFSLTAVVNFIFIRYIFREILYRTSVKSRLEGRRISLKYRIMLQVLPISIVAILFTSLLGYSRLIEDRGNLLFELYNHKLEDNISNLKVTNVGNISSHLRTINVDNTRLLYFIMKPDGTLITSDGTGLSDMFRIYLAEYSDVYNGRVYSESGSSNGAVIGIESVTGIWHAGVKYRVNSPDALIYLGCNFVLLAFLIIIIIYLFSRMLTYEVSAIASGFLEIASGFTASSTRRLPITSNDELGDLIVAFNKIRDCENNYDILKNEFIANVSHEFRTPLNIILNTLQLVGRYLQKYPAAGADVKLKTHLGSMKQNCYRLLKLVNNLIDSTKIDANFFTISTRNCDIVSLIREITMNVTEYTSHKGISLRFNSALPGRIIAVDPVAIERILLNLLSNAVKYNKKNGSINVDILEKTGTVEIVVSDTGIGISEEKLQHVFTRFTQIDRFLSKYHEGSGIGLSIVKSLVEMHNGTITVSSKLGEGTRFIISLPSKVQDEQPENGDKLLNRFDQGIQNIDIEFSDM